MVGRVFKTSFISSIDDSTFVQRYAARRVCFAWHFKLVFSLTFPALFKVGRRPPSPAVSREDCGNFVIWPCLISPLCWVVCYLLISLPKPQTQSPRLIHLPTRRHQAPGAEHRRLLRGAQRLEHPNCYGPLSTLCVSTSASAPPPPGCGVAARSTTGAGASNCSSVM